MPHSPIVAQPLLNGTRLPDLHLTDTDNQAVSLSTLRGARGTVISFIHGTWCPYCVRQLTRLNRAAPEIQAQGCGITCITHDPVDAVFAYQKSAQPALVYSLLADGTPSLAHTFGIYDPDHEAPYPAVFYADANDIILYSDVSSDPDCFPNMERLLEVIRAGRNDMED
jgi:peroxiredoxin